MAALITFDGTSYALPEGFHTGRNLRAFFGVPKTHELWGENDKDNSLIPDDDSGILIEDGMSFRAKRKVKGKVGV